MEHILQKQLYRQTAIFGKLIHLIDLNLGLGIMVFNNTFNNISVILWWSVLLVKSKARFSFDKSGQCFFFHFFPIAKLE
jgi:hypothetical protein